jgi:hypothetical protein
MATQIASLDDDPQQNGDSGSDDDEMPSLQPSVPTAASASVPPPPPAPEEEEDEAPEGIIFPPLSLRPIIDKTASFVARSGAQFEERIRENERGNPKFSFLNPRDPYYAYYQYRIVQTKAGKVCTELRKVWGTRRESFGVWFKRIGTTRVMAIVDCSDVLGSLICWCFAALAFVAALFCSLRSGAALANIRWMERDSFRDERILPSAFRGARGVYFVA